MGSFGSSDPFVFAAWAAGATTLLLTALVALQVLRIRRRSAERERRAAELVQTWRPALFEAALGGTPPVPRVERRDADAFMVLLNDVQDSLQGDARTALNRIARNTGSDAHARRLLRGGDAVGRVQALRMLGHLGATEDYEPVRALLDDPRSYLSLAAARALVRIDPFRAPSDVIPRLASRADWTVSLLVSALEGADASRLAAELRAACASASPATLLRLLPLVTVVDSRTGDEIVRRAFTSSPDVDVIAAALRYARGPAVLDLARSSCEHQAWVVRTQAASALGRVGTMPDRALLLRLLTDAQWWVRYRAAQALMGGRFGTPADVKTLAEGIQDRYARDILAQAAAEVRA